MRLTLLSLLVACAVLAGSLLSPVACLPADKPVVHFGVGLRNHPIVVYERFQPIMDYLTRDTPFRFELKVSRRNREAVRALVRGDTDISATGDGGLMKAMLRYGAIPVVKPLNEEGRPFYHSVIVVRADSRIRTLRDLKGKRFAFGCKHSLSGNMFPQAMLQKAGVRIEDLASAANLRNHTTVVMSVLKGESDAGAVKSTVARIYQQHGLRIIASSEEIPSVPLLVMKDAPKGMTKAVTQSLVKLRFDDPRDQQLMKNWESEYRFGFVPASTADYQDLIRKFKSIPYGCGRGCHQ